MDHDDFEALALRVVLDAELHTAAASLADWLPLWVRELFDAHAAEVRRLTKVGCLSSAAVWAAHGPMLDDFGESYGMACLDSHADTEGLEDPQVYPCPVLRALPGGSRVWDEILARYGKG